MVGQFGMLGRIFGAVPRTPANFGASMLNAGLRHPYHQHQFLGVAQAMRSNPEYGFPAGGQAWKTQPRLPEGQRGGGQWTKKVRTPAEGMLFTGTELGMGGEYEGYARGGPRKVMGGIGRQFTRPVPGQGDLPFQDPGTHLRRAMPGQPKETKILNRLKASLKSRPPEQRYPMELYKPPVAAEQPGILLGHYPIVPYKAPWTSRGMQQYTGSKWGKGITKGMRIGGAGMIGLGAYRMWRSEGDEGLGTMALGAGVMYGAKPLGRFIGQKITGSQVGQRVAAGLIPERAGGAAARVAGKVSQAGNIIKGMKTALKAIR